jgi:hypothetical protein
MRRLSSRSTFFLKRIFPVIWFGFLSLIALVLLTAAGKGRLNPLILLHPVAMALFGYVLMKKLVFDLADEVWDAGDALLIKNNREEDRILLSQIINVSYTTFQSPNRVTLTLRQPSRFGNEISFSARTRFLPFARNPLIDELIQRVDQARRAS